jgi:hypothetical protein
MLDEIRAEQERKNAPQAAPEAAASENTGEENNN